jgi:hypothetical protein
VFQALSEGQKWEREQRHAYELPVAQLTSVYANSQKTKPPYFNTSDFYFFALEDECTINVDVCATFLAIANDQRLPSWVLGLSPMEEIEKAKAGRVAKTRMWMCRGLALICPNLEEGTLTAGMAVIDDNCPVGEVEVFDVDSGEIYIIHVPEKFEEAYLLDVCWL